MGLKAKMDHQICVQGNRLCMGSLLKVILYGEERGAARQALEAAFAEARRLENLLSIFIVDSELSRVNRHAAYQWVKADPELISLIQQALSFVRLTRGAFDITVGPLMRLWGLREGSDVVRRPSVDKIQEVLRSVGCRKLMIDKATSSVRYLSPGLEVEFGAMGKGYAIDRAVQILKNHGISRALVSFGSSTYALGCPPAKEGWHVGIQHPRDPDRIMEIVTLRDQAVATSGDYEQYIFVDGQRFSHIIDPRIGHPVRGLSSVSVIAPTALQADALSTAALVLGRKAGFALLEGQPWVVGHLVSDEGKGKLETVQTSGWCLIREESSKRSLVGRRQFLTTLLVGTLLILGFPLNAATQVFMKPSEALEKLMPEAETVVRDQKTLTPELKKRLQEIIRKRVRAKGYTFFIGMKQEKPTGYATILNMIGKERPITFMVVINPDGTVRAAEVLVYRESKGFEIRSPRFMGQFKGKTILSTLRPGRDIDVITGATLSSRSATYVVKKALALVDVFYGIRTGLPEASRGHQEAYVGGRDGG